MKKILVSDSLRALIEAYDGLPSRKDFVVRSSPTAEGILSLHEAEQADLIIVDLNTPVMGGEALSFLLRRKEALKDVSIIVVCDGSGESLKRAGSCGANAVVSNPLDPVDMFAKIGELLNVRERKNVREIVKVSVKIRSAGDFFFAVSRNISSSGLLVETNRVLSPGDAIKCSLVLERTVAVEGEVIRVAKKSGESGETYEYGIKFTGLDPAAEAEIEEYVKKLKGK